MKKDIVEYLGFEDNSKNPVGRPKLADKKTKRKSLIIAGAESRPTPVVRRKGPLQGSRRSWAIPAKKYRYGRA